MNKEDLGFFDVHEKKLLAGAIALFTTVFGGSGFMVSNNVGKLEKSFTEMNKSFNDLSKNMTVIVEGQKYDKAEIKELKEQVKELEKFKLRVIEEGLFSRKK